MTKAIVFDYDGVIVDSFSSFFTIYKKICKHFGVKEPRDIKDFKDNFNNNFEESLRKSKIPIDKINDIYSIYKEEILKIDHGIFPGMDEVIIDLSKKYDLFIISSAYKDEVVSKMTRFNLLSFFKDIYCGADERLDKNKMTAELILKYKYNPNEVFFIGDRLVDYLAAKNVGADDKNIILTTYGWGLKEDSVGEARIINKPHEILNII
jgi:phosphoglycolate phosphatase